MAKLVMFSTRMPDDLLHALSVYAAQAKKTQQSILETALRKHLKAQKAPTSLHGGPPQPLGGDNGLKPARGASGAR